MTRHAIYHGSLLKINGFMFSLADVPETDYSDFLPAFYYAIPSRHNSNSWSPLRLG